MKNKKVNYIIGAIVVVLVLIGASYLGRSIRNNSGITEGKVNREEVSDFTTGGANDCHDSPKYFVVARYHTITLSYEMQFIC